MKCTHPGCPAGALGWRNLKDGGGTAVRQCAKHVEPALGKRLAPVAPAAPAPAVKPAK